MEELISEYYEKGKYNSQSSTINFKSANKLKVSGSTCDTYVTELKHRKVFVKRLKENLRYSTRHRAAFEKEYEIGVNLSHPSLPVYIDFQEDYIVMNYIDGRTLAEMLKAGDKWLSNGKNTIKVLVELLDVLEYLHRKGVIHCDIKTDNVMLTYTGNDVVLIDLDKVYTSHLADTSGSASRYGLEESSKRNKDIDFLGLSRVADKLVENVASKKVKKIIRIFSKKCKTPEVSAEELNKILHSGISSIKEGVNYNIRPIYIFFGVIIFLSIFFIPHYIKTIEEKNQKELTEEIETVQIDSFADSKAVESPGKYTNKVPLSKPSDTSRPHQRYIELDQKLTEHFNPLVELVDNTLQQYNKGELNEEQKREAIAIITEHYFDLLHDSYRLCQNLYPDLSPTEAQLKVADSQVFISVTKHVDNATRNLSGR